MRNSGKKKMVKIGQMKESLTKSPRSDEFHQKIRAFIPEDLIYKIMLMLPARSLGRFRCVSKSWLSITTCPSFIKAHLRHRRFSHQTLMIADPNYKKRHSQTRLFLPAFDSNINARFKLQELPQLKILSRCYLLNSCDGLILFRIPMQPRFHIINPLTGHFYILPRSQFNNFMGFYFHRSTSTYRLLADWDAEFSYVFVIGKTKWRRIHDRLPAITFTYNSVDVNESLYWIALKDSNDDDEEYPADSFDGRPNIIMTFDKEAEVYDLLPLPPSEEFNNRRGGSLINFNGELGLWLVSDNGIVDFWIMKECWIKRCSVYHPNLELSFRSLKYKWKDGFAISIKDEVLLIGDFRLVEDKELLIYWNLKTGTCLVQDLKDYSPKLLILFPYIEALTLFDQSFQS